MRYYKKFDEKSMLGNSIYNLIPLMLLIDVIPLYPKNQKKKADDNYFYQRKNNV